LRGRDNIESGETGQEQSREKHDRRRTKASGQNWADRRIERRRVLNGRFDAAPRQASVDAGNPQRMLPEINMKNGPFLSNPV
jgi:hypothetical protein